MRFTKENASEMGRRGFEATTRKYFQGSEAWHKEWLKQLCHYNYLNQVGKLYGDKFGYIEKPVHPAHGGLPF